MNNQIYFPKQDYKVLVCCNTYNQSKYIEDALNGFVMQQTDFPFCCLVIDDCSTDDEPLVIKSWMERECDMDKAERVEIGLANIILVPHKSNASCFFAFYFLKKNLYVDPFKIELVRPWHEKCEYEAWCEGDDYWTDPLKLQKQVDALDNNPRCTICIGMTKTMNADGSLDGGQMPSFPQNIDIEFSLEDFCREQFGVGQWAGHLSTFLFKTDIAQHTDECMKKVFGRFPYGDICMILCCLLQGNGIFIKEYMSNYRVLAGGWNSSMKANPDKAIAVEYKLIDGMNDFDAYTEYKYHRYSAKRILRSECLIEFLKGGRNGFVFLKPKYWCIAKMQGWKNTFLMVLQTMFPHLYPKLKKMVKG